MEKQKITVEALVAAHKNKVWEYYTQPQHITQWNFATPDWCCPSATNDLQAGGKYSARMEAKDGSFGFDFEAIYDEVIEFEKLLFTIADGRKTAVLFSENGNQTDVTVTFEAETVNPIELQRDGWQAILNNFKTYAEAV